VLDEFPGTTSIIFVNDGVIPQGLVQTVKYTSLQNRDRRKHCQNNAIALTLQLPIVA